MQAELGFNPNPFLAAAQKIDRAILNLSARFSFVVVSFHGINSAAEAVVAKFEKVRESFEMGAELSNLSHRTGQSVADLVVLRQAFENAGLGADDVGGKLNKLQKALAGMNEDGDKTEHVLYQLGTTVEDLRMMSAIKQIETLQKGFAGVKDQADRVLLAQKLFGKSGGNLLALFTDPTLLKNAREQTGGLAQTMERNAERFKEIAHSLESVKIKFQQFWAGVAEGVAPQIEGAAKAIAKMDFSEWGRMIGRAVGALMQLSTILKDLIPLVAGLAAQMLFTRVMSAMPALAAVARVSFASMATSGVAAARSIIAAFGPVGIAIALATAAFMHVQGKTARINATNSAVNEIGGESRDQSKDTSAAIRGLKTEEQRKSLAEELGKQLGEVQKRLAGVNEEFASLGTEGQSSVREALEMWAKQIQTYQRLLAQSALHGASQGIPSLFTASDKTPVSNRQRAAGGGWARVGDPATSELRRQTSILQQIRDAIAQGKPIATSLNRPPVPV